MSGILSYASHLPYWRLRRDAISATLGRGGGKGTRAVASFDEDSTTLAVAAARAALVSAPAVDNVLLATTAPAYVDKANAVAVHAALDLPSSVFAADMNGSVRSGIAALRSATGGSERSLVLLSDLRSGMPSSVDEREGGDAAAAFVVGPEAGLAEIVGVATATTEIADRWRLPGETSARTWEERFGEPVYVQAGEQALTDALKRAGLSADDIDHLIVTGNHPRAARALRRGLGVRKEAVVDDLATFVGNAGAAQPGLLLSAVLDVAEPGALIALLVLADGADAILLRTTAELAAHRQPVPVATQVAQGNDALPYATFLTWRGQLTLEPPRRPDPDVPMGPPARRSVRWKFGLVGSACGQCATRFAPPQRVCLDCGSVDDMVDARFADGVGTVRTFTVDRLAHTPSPPLVVAVIDVDGGGRIECEVTDLSGPEALAVGDRLEFTFRRLYTVAGVHNYFWKARPLVGAEEGSSR